MQPSRSLWNLLQRDQTLLDRTTILAPDLCYVSLLKVLLQIWWQLLQTSRWSSSGLPSVTHCSPHQHGGTWEKGLGDLPKKNSLLVRYVHDIFPTWPHEQALKGFLNHLNSQHPAIQFTMEKETDKKIAFLDVLTERRGTTTTTSVFRKKTHTDQYINSHHHSRFKCHQVPKQ